ncbi:MAG: TGS domain-containing protein [Candidatus Caldarchaeales archaeon]|nr:TGS domain-containing protein [Candidatus Caldarchaeales archaeon]
MGWGVPTNLPAEARHKLAEYQSAKTLEEKISVLSEALSLIPDHKGTEKLRRQLRKRLAELRDQLEERKARRVGVGHSLFEVKKEGWARVSFIGPANSGKSSLVRALTGAPTPVGEYPLTTSRPYPGMLLYENCEIQLLDLPAVLTEELEETALAPKTIGLARTSELLAIVVDATRDPERQFSEVARLLDDYGISLRPKKFEVQINRTDSGGLRIVIQGTVEGGYQAVRDLIHSLGIRSAIVKIVGDVSLEELEDELLRRPEYISSLIVVNKADEASEEASRSVERLIGLGYNAIAVSALSGDLTGLKKAVFSSLNMIRVYTRKDGIVSQKPLLLKRGVTVAELAGKIHRDFAERMKYARVWGRSVKVQGERVGPEHILEDGDVVELKI